LARSIDLPGIQLFNYFFNLEVKGGSDGCELWLSSLSTSYIEDWARGDPILWRTVKLQFPPNLFIKIVYPTSQAIVTFSKVTKTYLLYIFLLDTYAPRGIVDFAVRLRTDGSLDTLNQELKIEYLQTIPVVPDRDSDLRVESTDDRVFCFWTQGGKVTGKSAPFSDDGVVKNDEWVDFCEESKRPALWDGPNFGSALVPGNFVVTPDNDYRRQ
jgi:hypothetical protein